MTPLPVIQSDLSVQEIARLQMFWKDSRYPLGVVAMLVPVVAPGGLVVEAFAPKHSLKGVTTGELLGALTQEQFDEVVRDRAVAV